MNNERRKKIVVPVVLLLGIFIGGVVVLRTQGIGAQMLTEGKKVLFPIASEPDADPDGDGLKNWQEETYKTDPRNPDTDGDGYLDGEEVASGYDPTIASPNDALEGTDTSIPRPLPKNLTTHLAQILAEKISSGEIEPSQGDSLESIQTDPNLPYNQDVINEAFAQIGLRAKEYFGLPSVENEEIRLLESPTTKESVARYISTMANSVSPDEAMSALEKSIPQILSDAVKNKSSDEIEIVLSSQNKNIEAVRSIPVPAGFEEIHKHQLALLLLDIKIFEAVKEFEKDPAMAVAAIETYLKLMDSYKQFGETVSAKIQEYNSQ